MFTTGASTTVLASTRSALVASPHRALEVTQSGRVTTAAPASRNSGSEPSSAGPSTTTSKPRLRSTGTALTSTMGAPVMVSSWLRISARRPLAENTSSAHSSRRKCSSACGMRQLCCAMAWARRSSSVTLSLPRAAARTLSSNARDTMAQRLPGRCWVLRYRAVAPSKPKAASQTARSAPSRRAAAK